MPVSHDLMKNLPIQDDNVCFIKCIAFQSAKCNFLWMAFHLLDIFYKLPR